MDLGQRSALIVFALVVVMAMVYSQRDDSNSSTTRRSETTPKEERGPLGGEDGANYTAEQVYHGELPYRVHGTVVDLATVDAPQEIGARALKLRKSEKGLTLTVAIKSTPRCMIGDLDIITREIKADPNAKLLVSIEPVLTSFAGFTPIAQETTLGKLRSGSAINFVLPEDTKPHHLALFICKDSSGDGRCGSKEVEDLNGVMDMYYTKNPPSPSNPPGDKIYFFTYLILEGSSLTSFDNELELQAYDKLSGYIAERTRSTGAKEISKWVKFLNDTIRSANIDFLRNRMVIDLPRNDSGMCGDLYKELSPETFKAPLNNSAQSR